MIMKGHYIGIFIPLVSISLCIANDQTKSDSTGMVVNVAKALVGLFDKDKEQSKDLTTAKEFVKGLKFDKFEDKISSSVSKGILLQDYPTVIADFARKFSIPEDIKNSLLDGQYAENMAEQVMNFQFEKGKTGSYVYGRVATIKHGDKIDLAYSVYILQFKIAPTVIKHQKKRRVLGITVRKKVWYESIERQLSTDEKNRLKDYSMMKAIERFRSEYAGLIEASQYCDAHGNCN